MWPPISLKWKLCLLALLVFPSLAMAQSMSIGTPVQLPNSGTAGTTSRYESFPFELYDAGNSTLSLFYRSAPWPISLGNGCHAGSTCRGMEKYYTSANNGATWSAYSGTNQCQSSLDGTGSSTSGQPYGCLFDLPLDGSNYQDVRTGAGGITSLGTYINCAFVYENGTDTGVWCSRSTNQGASWSTFSQLPTPCTVTYGPLVVVSSSKIGIVCGSATTTDITYSADDGVTWGTPVEIGSDASGLYESAFQYVGNNTIIGVMRNEAATQESEPQFT
jgi:hypothetical protein